jgi:hypothetical protein
MQSTVPANRGRCLVAEWLAAGAMKLVGFLDMAPGVRTPGHVAKGECHIPRLCLAVRTAKRLNRPSSGALPVSPNLEGNP